MSWKRLESATVNPALTEGLEARVADPPWMLARQWQTGEFKGDDAANPLLVRVEARSISLERLLLPGGHAVDLREVNTPLEPLVEREAIRRGPAAPRVAADLGRLLVRALRRARAPLGFVAELRSRYPAALPPDDGLDPSGRRRLELLARAGLDGARLAADLSADPAALDEILAGGGYPAETGPPGHRGGDGWLRDAGGSWSEPEEFTAWDPQRLEYRFELTTTGADGEGITLDTADGYAGGRLDWFAFDRAEGAVAGDRPGEAVVRRAEVLPAPLRFRGMPAARFWELEEGDLYLGGIEAAPEDLARVAVAGYGVVYGGDWMTVPIRIPLGTMTEITQVTVVNDFGRVSTVPAAAVVDGGADDRAFRFFEVSGDGNPRRGRAPLLFLPPTVETTDAGRPLEDVRFLRDEMANVAWAVEHRVESVAGRPVDVAARRAPATRRRSAGEDGDGAWRLVLSTPVPDNWVPLIPVRLREEPGSGGPTAPSCSSAAGCRAPPSRERRGAPSASSSRRGAGC